MEATTTTTTSVHELRRLIASITALKLPICIRYRAVGQLWYPNFLRIVHIEQNKSVLFFDADRNTMIALSDWASIVEFEVDRACHSFQARCQYQIS